MKKSINEALKNAMKEKNAEKLSVLRSIIAKITEAEKLNSNIELTDDEIVKVVQKLAKQREESINLFKQGNREDLVAIEEFQLSVLKEYLPQMMSEDEVRNVVKLAIENGANNIGLLMKELNRYGSLIDKKIASQIAKELL
jgi:uncharacterized protein YqeY